MKNEFHEQSSEVESLKMLCTKAFKGPSLWMFKLLNIVIFSNFDQEWDFEMVQIHYTQFASAAVYI